MKLTAPIIATFLAVAVFGCVDRSKQEQSKQTEKLVSDPSVPVVLADVQTQDIKDTLEITGNLTSGEDSIIGAKQPGKITAVYVKDGEHVQAGQLLASQDTAALSAQLQQALGQLNSARSALTQAQSNELYGPSKSSAAVRQAEAQLRSAKAQLQKSLKGARPEERDQANNNVKSAKSNLDTALKDLQRKQALVTEGALAQNTLDQAQNVYAAALTQYTNAVQSQLIITRGNREEDISAARETVRAAQSQLANARSQKQLDVLYADGVRTAQAQIQSSQALVNLARSNLSDAQIRAPFAGRVSGKPIQAGTVLGAGGTILRLIGGQGIYFDGQVPEDKISLTSVGSQIQVTVDGLAGRVFAGRVAAINPLGSDVGRLFRIRVSLIGDLTGTQSNMFARGVLTLRTIPHAVVVPIAAIVKVNGQNAVFGMVDGKAKAMPVTPGIRFKDVQQVTGLAPATRIVVSGQQGIFDGTALKEVKPASIDTKLPAGTTQVGG